MTNRFTFTPRLANGSIFKSGTPDVICLPDRSHEPVKESFPEIPSAKSAPVSEPRVSLRKRLAVLIAVIAVPAMAAPGDFGAEPADAPHETSSIEAVLASEQALAFERPGMSFPGSAFYYLADPPSDALIALPATDPLDTDSDNHKVGELIDAGPAARGFLAAGTGISKARAQECLAQAVWYEAASESEAGQRAVAQVVLNRVTHPSWPSSVCGVVYQGSSRSTGCQFSFTCDGSLGRKAKGASWARAQRVAAQALAGDVYTPIGHATHYHTLWVNPYWAGSLDHVGTIGAHRFYRHRGSAGQKSAFTMHYAGNEPSVRGRTSPLPIITGTDRETAGITPARIGEPSNIPTAQSRRSSTSVASSAPQAEATGSPLADPELRSAGQVRESYANVGKWKTDPTTLDLSIDHSSPTASSASGGGE